MLQKVKKEENIISSFTKENENNHFNTKNQIINLTKKINELQQHFIKNKKDRHSRRGLLKKVSRRRKLLNYLKSKSIKIYSNLIRDLKLRN
ncbi:30S ribosomal subunit protein S15 [Wigglesworthia glossinidia endosymbiont of Glossina morsitans morsitans (Yale colony)]|uniref:Small ribosomal subunit protein uS15 n=1 Tax=Wigglesworthia glossinidia endosymbiont of Glossina morsitans morsitans (Yale colony) TaxID=1142511 RepID=H6Q594_WIGGL|nr:30S ribosomal protein S15 [Wigglesworthia glossinidia]AFA41377.1 30S ribosomal subunit protein S15 [Wigglesworthia glossinidia endosymbiont of Glossina morsitans morsitans (Yale colony)]